MLCERPWKKDLMSQNMLFFTFHSETDLQATVKSLGRKAKKKD